MSRYSTGSPPSHPHFSQNLRNWEGKAVSLQNVASVANGGREEDGAVSSAGNPVDEVRRQTSAKTPARRDRHGPEAFAPPVAVMWHGVRGYLAYSLSSRDLEDMRAVRGVGGALDDPSLGEQMAAGCRALSQPGHR
ncbi:integrase [Pandoraea sputorum]|uniref:Integrase n=1 Tax=Pandoraea sputorum TaxID=93222 RepID=A0A5E5BI85_9BURK|nr:integrase [Pandoraea sputorum]